MKHIPIMLALALSISLTSYDGTTTTESEYNNLTQETSNIVMTQVLDEDMKSKSEIDI